MIADSGCKWNIAGEVWHREAQKWLASQGLCAQEEVCADKFRFGDGRLVKATRSWKFPCGNHGINRILNIAEVPKDCPPLLSVGSMQQMGVILDFRNRSISVGDRTEHMTLLLPSGHPVLSVSEFDQSQYFDDEFLCKNTLVSSVPEADDDEDDC